MLKTIELNLVVRGQRDYVSRGTDAIHFTSWHWLPGPELTAKPEELVGTEVALQVGDCIVARESLLSVLQPCEPSERQQRMLEDLVAIVRALTPGAGAGRALHLPPGFFRDAVVAPREQLLRMRVTQLERPVMRLDLRCVLRGHFVPDPKW